MKIKIGYILIAVLSVIFISLICFFTFQIFKHYINFQNISLKSIFVANGEVNVTKYAIYGTHLNLEGNLNLEKDINNKDYTFNLVILDENLKENRININYKITNNILSFYTSKTINQGIFLDGVSNGSYSFYLKIKNITSGLSKYYKLKNTTKYNDLEYYTITKNNENNKIDLKWNDTLMIICKKEKLPNNYYDIVIDQGHGGKSTGAIANGYTEATLTYDIGKKLQKSLEQLGLKVLTTRNEINETVPDYDENGRTVIPNKVKAKYCFSIHINSSTINENASGVEIYCPNHAELTLGKMLADNIIRYTNSNISPNNYGRYSGGVYVLTFNEDVIEECRLEALDDGYEPYNISLDTPLFFMIREVGGISTKAYTDGRNREVGKNLYYDSNQTAEGYLLELGYISNKEEITKIDTHRDEYVEAITQSIKDYLCLY